MSDAKPAAEEAEKEQHEQPHSTGAAGESSSEDHAGAAGESVSTDKGSEADSGSDRSGGGGASGSADAADSSVDEAEARIEQDTQEAKLARERDEYLDSLRRLQADFENYKKRVSRQQEDLVARAAENLVEKLLPVLDTADLAMEHGGGSEVAQLHGSLVDALGKEGLERIFPAGESFDPNVADAVAHEPDEGESGPTVAEVLRAGYKWKGRVIRPAMVKVKG